MKISPAAVPLVILRSILLQNAALKQPDKSRSHTKKGPGRMPYRATQPAKKVVHKGKVVTAALPRLMRATGPQSLDEQTERRKDRWLVRQRLRTV